MRNDVDFIIMDGYQFAIDHACKRIRHEQINFYDMLDVLRGGSAGHLADDIHRVYCLILHLIQHHLQFLLPVVQHAADSVQFRRDGFLAAAQEVLNGEFAR